MTLIKNLEVTFFCYDLSTVFQLLVYLFLVIACQAAILFDFASQFFNIRGASLPSSQPYHTIFGLSLVFNFLLI